jgi:hypothetical protein
MPLCAQEPNTLTAEEKAEGWELLFNGRTLEGWNNWKTKSALTNGAWTVQDHALALIAKGGGDIYYAMPFENFDLKLEWKAEGNSGIMIRIDPSLKGPIWRVAPEMQILNTSGNGKKDVAALYDLYACEGDAPFNTNDWNSVRILMKDGTATHWFNGHKIYSYTIGSDDWKERVANSKWQKSQGYGETAKGHIGLQDHGHLVSFRNIRIKPLHN